MGFYGNLTGDGVFFFWLAIVLSCILVGLAIFLLYKNRKLATLLKEEKKAASYSANKEDNVQKVIDPIDVIEKDNKDSEVLQISNKDNLNGLEMLQIDNKKESIPLKNKEVVNSKEDKYEYDSKFIFSDDEEIPKSFESSTEEKKEVISDDEAPKPYQKNVLREMSKKMPISPIHIEKNYIDEDVNIYSVSNDDNYDLEEVYLEDESISPLEEIEDTYSVNDNMKFASEVVSRMEEEMKPSNIELTDYEKKQEEEAIISYEELQKVKDKIYNLTEEEDDGEFIDELKNFRLDLK